MEYSFKDLVSIEEIMSDVLLNVDDIAMKKRTPGFYRAQVKYGIDELAFEIPFNVVIEDIKLIDGDLTFPVPSGAYNLTGIQVYTGDPDNIEYVQNVYWKRNFTTKGYNKGYTSDYTEYNITDPFVRCDLYGETGLFFFNVQNGVVYLSDSCADFDYARTMFSGIPSKVGIDHVKIVPPFVKQAIILWATERAARSMKMLDPKYRQIQIDTAQQLDEYGYNGAWHQAKVRLGKLDYKKYKDLMKYQENMI